MIKIVDYHKQRVLKSGIFSKIFDDLTTSESFINNVSILDIFIDSPCLDINQFLKDLLTLEIKELLSNSNYRIITYKNLLDFQKVLSHSTNATTRRENLSKLKSNYKIDKNIIHFLPSYTDLNEQELVEICRNKPNFDKYLELLFQDLIILNLVLSDIFDYEKFIKPYRKTLLSSMEIEICPYCNISNIINTDEFSTADVDHFYPKSKYPLFSLSFGNFIPSCKSCNQVFKGSSPISILNPRERGFDDDSLFYISNILDLLNTSHGSFKVEVSVNQKDKDIANLIDQSINLFKIEDCYNSPGTKDEIRDKIKMANLFRSGYMKSVNDLGVSKTIEEFYEAFFSIKPTDKDFLNKRYGKLKSDLFKLDYFKS